MARSVSLVAFAAVLSIASAQRLSIEPCTRGYAAESFTAPALGTPGPVKQVGTSSCVTFDSTSLLLATCDGSASQTWTFRPDGTVLSASSSGNCWNVIGGSTSAGSTVGIWSCGTAVAANDLFWPIPGANTIIANETGYCLSSAVPPPPPCQGDLCCSLNGVRDNTTQTCTCYPPWGGPTCASLQVLPALAGGSYGMNPNRSTWGGNLMLVDGTYHMYLSEMANDCPLSDWGSNSQCRHATSTNPLGPYQAQDIAVPVWCHNVLVVPDAANQKYFLFHIGTGSGGNPKNCTPPSSAVSSYADLVMAPETTTEIDPIARRRALRASNAAAAGSTLHESTSPNGPWTPVSTPPPGCNNPAPWIHPNGTWYLVCDSVQMYSAPSAYGPWTSIMSIHPSGGVAGTYEDAFGWIDPRGNWHLIFHVYTTDVPSTCVNSTVSGHYFSQDGLNWIASPTEPITNFVQFTDGSSVTLSTRERPHLLFNAAGDPTHIINGVCAGSSFCAPTPCVNCKYNFWDFTLVQPLNTPA